MVNEIFERKLLCVLRDKRQKSQTESPMSFSCGTQLKIITLKSEEIVNGKYLHGAIHSTTAKSMSEIEKSQSYPKPVIIFFAVFNLLPEIHLTDPDKKSQQRVRAEAEKVYHRRV